MDEGKLPVHKVDFFKRGSVADRYLGGQDDNGSIVVEIRSHGVVVPRRGVTDNAGKLGRRYVIFCPLILQPKRTQ